MSGSEDDRLLEDYLRGASDVSRSYRELGAEDLPDGIDERIIARAADAVRNAPERRSRMPRSWYFGVATAAVIVLSVAIVLDMGVLESVAPRRPASSAPASAPRAEGARESRSDEGSTVTPVRRPSPAESALDAPQVPGALGDASPAPGPAPAARQEQEVMRTKQSRTESAAAVPAAAQSVADSASYLGRPAAAERDGARDPDEWIAAIIRLRAAGESEQADRELERFTALNPDYPIPAAARSATDESEH